MTTIEKIKAEIQRMLIELGRGYDECDWGQIAAYEHLLTFISTLESEKPMNLDFEQELYNRFGMVKDFTLGMRIAQAFYELGCTRTAEKYDEIEYNRQRAEESVPNDLEAAARKSAIAPFNLDVDEEHLYEYPYLPIAEQKFIEGAKWKKEQMMKEAVEGTVYGNGKYTWVAGDIPPQFKYGDKVRIIIVKDNN